MSGGIVGEPTTGDMEDACDTLLWLRSWSTDYRGPLDDCWCDREQCEHTEWVPEIESWVRCTANTLMHTPDTRVLCPAHCGCGNIDLGESGAA